MTRFHGVTCTDTECAPTLYDTDRKGRRVELPGCGHDPVTAHNSGPNEEAARVLADRWVANGYRITPGEALEVLDEAGLHVTWAGER